MKIHLLFLSILLLAGQAMAGFTIDSTKIAEVEKPKSTGDVLLIDTSIQWASITGNCEPHYVTGSASDIEVGTALRLIIPTGWKVYSKEDLSFQSWKVDLVDGELWTKTITRLAQRNKVRIDVNCLERIVSIQKGASEGVFADSDQIQGLVVSDSVQPETNSVPQSTTNSSVSSNGISPNKNETVYTYLQRYSDANHFSRIIYRVKNLNRLNVVKMETSSGSLNDALTKHDLYALKGRDPSTSETALVITDDEKLKSYSEASILVVTPGLLSDAAIRVASMYGWQMPPEAEWPLDQDFQIPYSYDLVSVDISDAFGQLFKGYPVQAQLYAPRKTVYISARNTARKNTTGE